MNPQDPATHRAHAAAAQAAGRTDDAIAAMRAAASLAPDAVSLQIDLGQMLASAGYLDEAIAVFREATERQPDLVEAWFFLGMALYTARRDAEALPAFERAHALAPAHPQIVRALAESHYALEHHAEALRLYERIAGMERSDDVMLFLRISQCRRRSGALTPALDIVRSGIARFPDEALLWQELGWVQEDLGDATQAQEAYARAHALRPGWADPVGSIIALASGAASSSIVEKAEAMLVDAAVPGQQKAFLHHVLGKRSDGLGDHAAAAVHWDAANRLRRSLDVAFDRGAYAARVDAIIATFTAEYIRANRDAASRDERPLFVVGMPRSGTTLVEQILAAHPQAHGCGELAAIPDIVDAMSATSAWHDENHRLHHAQNYLQIAARHAPQETRRLVDKQPYNFLHVGAIGMLFADARIVWCRRDPRDIALSIYSESFAPSATHATDLGDIAFVIAQQERLMQHWQAVSPLPILEMHYERMVEDSETQIRRLVDFAGLPWDARCLDFHASRRPVQTLSRWQVRQPVHARSVGRWRNYPQWFGVGGPSGPTALQDPSLDDDQG
jgi:tetratricopeptide (TPR) repeat protein